MRLIDADRALEIVRNRGIAHPNAYHLTNYATLILREAPTVDAVKVVRCKDCKYRFKNNGHSRDGCPIIDANIWMAMIFAVTENGRKVLTDGFEIFVQGVFMHNSISLCLPAF